MLLLELVLCILGIFVIVYPIHSILYTWAYLLKESSLVRVHPNVSVPNVLHRRGERDAHRRWLKLRVWRDVVSQPYNVGNNHIVITSSCPRQVR